MQKIINVALREFLATVTTKGFILGVLIMPMMMLVVVMVLPRLMNKNGPAISGRVAVIDQSGKVGEGVRTNLDAEAIRARLAATLTDGGNQAAAELNLDVDEDTREMMKAGAKAAAAMEKAPTFYVDILPPDADVQKEKAMLLDTKRPEGQRLAVAVVPSAAVSPSEKGDYGGFDLFGSTKLDPEIREQIRGGVSEAIVSARLADSNYDATRVRKIMARPVANEKSVTESGDQKTSRMAAVFLPMGFMMLLWISVFTAGQGLLTSTIEEKASRIMEVLLSAASPMQIMTGKIFGQMGVGAVIMSVYAVLGLGGLSALKYLGLIEWGDIGLLIIYFFIAFFLVAAMMAAIGSAVNDMREAQSLMTPVMLVLVVPMILWLPIARNPNSVFAQVLSFIPPISPFIMVVRVAGAEPIPMWQIPASIVLGLLSAYGAVWGSAKIFRIGVLMYGKPPNMKTLFKWIRMA
ncbi:MAG: ABC transporter permease [Pyrinomonadaceae bacterium]|nr:ABC transporter permease [Phycisphaerales bacterium]